jgi:RNA-metabolizing metallo-beta-lactamase
MVFGVGDVGNIVLRDRQMLSQDGLIIVVLNLSQETGGLISDPDIISRGFVYVRENEELLQTLKELVKVEINDLEEKEWSTVKAIVKNKLQKYIFKKTKRDPMILPIIVEV